MKTLVWIIGGNGSGKTTQSKMLVNAITEEQPISVEGDRIHYTLYREKGLAVLGKVGRNQCTGLDTVYPKLGSEGVGITLKAAIEDNRTELIIVESMFGSTKWYQNWIDVGIRSELNILLIHLDSTLWNSYKRISQRRAKKQGREDWWNVELEDTVYKSVGNKNKETKVIFDKLTGVFPKKSANFDLTVDAAIQLDFTETADQIHNKIIEFISKNI